MTGKPSTERESTPTAPRTAVEVLPALILAFIAATLVLVGQVTPTYESVELREVLKNTLLQQDIGWVFVVGSGLLLLCSLYGKNSLRLAGWIALVVGALIVALVAVAGLNEEMRTLTSALPDAPKPREELGVASIGIYLTAIGGMTGIAAGVALLWADAGRRN